MASSCSHWWHAPVYVTISIVLAIVAISTPSSESNPKTQKPDLSIQHELSLNASLALRKSGFNFMATLLQISPELIIPSSSQATIFAINDETISNISVSPQLLKDLLKYHTSPFKITIEDLLNKSQNSCLPTLFQGNNLTVTKINRKQRLVEINGVLISNPDIFNQGSYSIHGVHKLFSPINQDEFHLGFELIQSPVICGSGSNSSLVSTDESRKVVSWRRILRLLSSNGFISFAIGLNSVLHGLHRNQLILMNSVTIFAPQEFSYVATSTSALLEKIVKIHLIPERLTYKELASSMTKKTPLKTLVPDVILDITMGNSNVNEEILAINGVEITAPDVLLSNGFIVHGISRPIETMKLSPSQVKSISG